MEMWNMKRPDVYDDDDKQLWKCSVMSVILVKDKNHVTFDLSTSLATSSYVPIL